MWRTLAPMPAAKPAALKIAEGRGNNRDKAGRPVNPPLGWVRLPPVAPAWMEGDARTCWDETVDALQRLQLTKEADHPTLVAYCLAYARMVQAAAEVREHGLTTVERGKRIARPEVLILERASKDVVAYAQQLGMTPASEQKLSGSTDDGAEVNPFG